MKLQIGSKVYDVEIAKTKEERKKGLSFTKLLPAEKGMLFIYETPQDVSFWMKDTSIELDIVFIDKNSKVISIKYGKPESTEPITENDVKYVLEVNADSGVSVGDDVRVIDKTDNSKKFVLKVLDDKGEVQMELEGDERIYSKVSTKEMIRLAKIAKESGSDEDYRKLGEYVIKETYAQMNRKQETITI